MRLILVRHGQTTSNVEGLLDTAAPGAQLTDLGREQADGLPQALAGEPVAALFVSTLRRTQQTAAPLAAALGLEPQVREGIREIAAGDLEMRGDEAAVRAYLAPMAGWGDGELDVRVPGAESGREVLDRFDAVVAEAAGQVPDAAAAVLVSHGAVVRCWAGARASNLDGAFVTRTPLLNTGVVVLDGSPARGWTALTWQGDPLSGPEEDPGEAGPAAEPAT